MEEGWWLGMPTIRPEDQFGDRHLYWLEWADRRREPERVLWAAVLARAMTDVLLWHAGRRRAAASGRDGACHASVVTLGVYRDAVRWFRQRRPKRMGFLEVCELLELRPELVLERLERMKAQQRALRVSRRVQCDQRVRPIRKRGVASA